MSVLITTLVLVLLGLWATAVYGRLLRLRRAVRSRWRDVTAARERRQGLANGVSGSAESLPGLADAEQALEQARLHYNLIATKYNATITGIPGNIIAAVSGFKRAELLSPDKSRHTDTDAQAADR